MPVCSWQIRLTCSTRNQKRNRCLVLWEAEGIDVSKNVSLHSKVRILPTQHFPHPALPFEVNPPAAPPPLFLKLWGTQNIPQDCGGWGRESDSLQSNRIMMERPTGVLLVQVFTGMANQIHCISCPYKHAHTHDSPLCSFTRRVRRNDQRRKGQEEKKKYSCLLGQATGPKPCCAELGKSLH